MHGIRRTPTLVTVVTLIVLLAAGCGSSSGSDGTQPTTRATAGTSSATTATAPAGKITVAAAASLTEAFTQIGKEFEAANPGTTVTFTFDSSGTLATQIASGAPVDAFASADAKNMDAVAKDPGIEGTPTAFARNRLVIVTKSGNPKGIEGLADLPTAGIVALCATDAPCGKFAAQALDEAEVTIPESSVTRGQNAKATLAAVAQGDADAGIVYVTDAEAAGDAVATVTIPDDQNVVATYPVAVVAGTDQGDLAQAFVAYLSSDDAQKVLAEAGFLPPT
ncbi:MAG: molybdate ABC transporter substrate-binding protein [Acidimicrobiales bacterium]